RNGHSTRQPADGEEDSQVAGPNAVVPHGSLASLGRSTHRLEARANHLLPRDLGLASPLLAVFGAQSWLSALLPLSARHFGRIWTGN
ncbi:hypothetical protein PENTCL1PPCAC_10749, partial [Pristionchus entomophagus]